MASSKVFDGVRPPRPLVPILWPEDPQSIVAGADAAYWKFWCLLGGSSIDMPPLSSPRASSGMPPSWPYALSKELECGDGSGSSKIGGFDVDREGRTRGFAG
eukprot:CAMPEP_0181193224 /NCGR_PEP_ID=MMETSP1096-20121128/13706_1 /TAXON_ID=156174 ORGANISM="Chrysochromulina ericina, Strain CCMP281" /NCGR_SAMPLE_ID=MMETSP1096 /ASSEMBLY_ACC=CAM_ASM_000453 /LENGTH=101 /DNA_ID=CAMNT_0023282679 /DNA_START=612 /DNA_END=917 /DNA_ORIENTATION=-